MSQIGTGEGESPLAPRPSTSPSGSGSPLEARTLSSDLSSIKSGGGSEPVPYTPPPSPSPRPASGASPTPQSTFNRPSFTPPPGMATGGMKPPSPPAPPSSIIPSIDGMKPSPVGPVPAPKKGDGKKVFIAILSFLIVIALGAVGYFFIYPLLTEKPPASPAPSTSPILPEAGIPEAPSVPSEETTSTASESPTEEPETPAADPWGGIQGLSTHRSLFTAAPDETREVILSAPTLEALKGALPSGSVASPILSEIRLTMPSGNTVPFSRIASLLAPSFFTSARLASFDEDATYFTYAAANGTWLGIVAPLRPGVAIGPVQDGMSAIQSDPNLSNFFLEAPGAQGVWVDGSVRNRPTSQVSFEAAGATFSYTWLDRNLLISTNLIGAEAAAERLGF